MDKDSALYVKIKKLKVELAYAKFRCALPNIMDMMSKMEIKAEREDRNEDQNNSNRD